MDRNEPQRYRKRQRILGVAVMAAVLGSRMTVAQPPLAGLFAPPADTVASTLFCPDCLRRPLLFEVHLKGSPISIRDGSGAAVDVDAAGVDVDLIVFRPHSAAIPAWPPDCAHPPAFAVSHDVEPCYQKEGFAAVEIHPESTGWYDHFSRGQGLFLRESFFAGSRADLGLEAGAQWCILPFLQGAKMDGLTAALEMELTLGEAETHLCTTDVAVEAGLQDHAVPVLQGCGPTSPPAPRRPSPAVVELKRGGGLCVHVAPSWKCTPEVPRCPES